MIETSIIVAIAGPALITFGAGWYAFKIGLKKGHSEGRIEGFTEGIHRGYDIWAEDCCIENCYRKNHVRRVENTKFRKTRNFCRKHYKEYRRN